MKLMQIVQHDQQTYKVYMHIKFHMIKKHIRIYVSLTLSWWVKGTSLRRTVDIWMRPLTSLIDQRTVRVGDVLNLQEGRPQFSHCEEENKKNKLCNITASNMSLAVVHEYVVGMNYLCHQQISWRCPLSWAVA